jgi:thiosulfate dehydrogenase (quinone) large subunit
MHAMTWVRILVGSVWLNGGLEKLLNPDFPQQFATSLSAGGYISQAPQWFQSFMQVVVVPHAELFANLTRAGELALGIGFILGVLTNLTAIGSIVMSGVFLASQGGISFGTGLGSPEILTVEVIITVLSLIVLLSPSAKAASLDGMLADRIPRLALILTNTRHQRA